MSFDDRLLNGVTALAAVVRSGGFAAAAGGVWQLLDAQSFAAAQHMARMNIEKTLEDHPAQAWFKKR